MKNKFKLQIPEEASLQERLRLLRAYAESIKEEADRIKKVIKINGEKNPNQLDLIKESERLEKIKNGENKRSDNNEA